MSISSGIRLVVDNTGFRPEFISSGLKRRRAFDAKFRLVRNQLPVPYDPRIAAIYAANNMMNQKAPGTADASN